MMHSNNADGWVMGIYPMAFGGVGMIIFWLLIAVALYGVVRLLRLAPKEPRIGQPLSAREVLDKRYACGDIDRGSYLQMCADLENRSTTTT